MRGRQSLGAEERPTYADYVGEGGGEYFRVFVPLFDREGERKPWTVAATEQGVTLGGETAYSEVTCEGEPTGNPEVSPPHGCVDAHTAARLVRLLDGRADAARELLVTEWVGYTPENEEDRSPGADHRALCRAHGGDAFDTSIRPRDWVLSRTDDVGLRFPVGIARVDRRAVIVGAPYFDSLVVSGPHVSAAALRDAGLEWVEIDPQMTMPAPSR